VGQDVDPGAAGNDVVDHLDRDLPGIAAHPLGGDAVIRRHGDDGLSGHGGRHLPGYAGQLLRQIHEAPQGPVGHGQLIETCPGRRPGIHVDPGKILKDRFQ